jgi:hypothetical protein
LEVDIVARIRLQKEKRFFIKTICRKKSFGHGYRKTTMGGDRPKGVQPHEYVYIKVGVRKFTPPFFKDHFLHHQPNWISLPHQRKDFRHLSATIF